MRVYLPSTLTGLRALAARGEVGPAPVAAYAVTPGLREEYSGAGNEDLEELEYAAMTEAARDSMRLLAADPDARRRRVVLAADVPDAAVTPAPQLGPAGVHVKAPVPLRRVVSVHVDDSDAEPDVAEAARTPEAPPEGLGDRELMWFAVQEIADLLHGSGTDGQDGRSG